MISIPHKPRIIEVDEYRGIFEIEGLYPGYGHTVGNSLRRVLLSSLKGAVITSIKIEGVGHEFSTMPGVLEDAVELVLNFKQLRFKLHEEWPVTILLNKKGLTKITGKDFDIPSQVELLNPDAHIATLTTKDARLTIEAVVESGLGYVPVEARTKDKVEVGTIALDASFSPVRHVNYQVENMRVGDRTDYNRVRIEIETDGSVSPKDAFLQSAQILVGQFGAISEGFTEADLHPAPAVPTFLNDTNTNAMPIKEDGESEEIEEDEEGSSGEESVLRLKLDELKISSRTLNALREAGIKTVGGLARKREETLREIGGLGDKGIQELKKVLASLGVALKQ